MIYFKNWFLIYLIENCVEGKLFGLMKLKYYEFIFYILVFILIMFV